MSKIGVNLSIDVKAIDKARLVPHTNGKTYLNMTVFIDPDSPGKHGDHGMITQEVSKDERAQGVQGAILGNAKVFWQDQQQAPQPAQQQAPAQDDIDQSIPF